MAGTWVALERPVLQLLLILLSTAPQDEVEAWAPQTFAPQFAEGPLAQAKAHFDARRFEKARVLLATQGDANPVRFLRALSALRANQPGPAATEFDALIDSYPELSDYCRWYAAMAWAKQRRLDEAAARYAAISMSSLLFAKARLALASALEQRGDPAGAAAAVDVLLRSAEGKASPVRAQALWQYAQLAQRAGQKDAARAALLELWVNHPLFSAVGLAAAVNRIQIPLEGRLSRAEALIAARQPRPAATALQPLIRKLPLDGALACRAHLAYGKALRADRRRDRAIPVLTRVVAQCTDSALRVAAMGALAGAQAATDPRAAVATWDALAHDYPDDPAAREALVLAARLVRKQGDAEAAQIRHLALANLPTANPDAEGLFRAFWTERSRGDYAAAIKALEQTETVGARVEEVLRARYWRARTLIQLHEVERAIAGYGSILAEQPAGYYALLARERLAELNPAGAERVAVASMGEPQWPIAPGPLAQDAHFLAGVELMRLGLPLAELELGAVDKTALPLASLQLLFEVVQAAGLTGQARVIARAWVERSHRPDESQPRPMWQLAYPRHFRELIERHSRSAAVDPDLLQALIKEESSFRHDARSPVGALGLTQLMPPTAREIGRALKLGPVTEKSMLEPTSNIKMGSAYLATLLRRFAQNRAIAVASYNAGPTAVSRWLAERPGLATDEWVEEIPVTETREYVKRVLGSYHSYLTVWAAASKPASAGGAAQRSLF